MIWVEVKVWLTLGIAIAVFLGLTVLWIWLCLGVRKSGRRYVLGMIACQLSVVAGAAGLSFGIVEALLAAMYPLIFLLWVKLLLSLYPFLWGILQQSLIWLIPFAVLPVIFKPVRRWVIVWLCLPLLGIFMILAEKESRHSMCDAALEMGESEIRRNTFRWSIRNGLAEFAMDIHALMVKDGVRYGWSYRQLDWYAIPSGVHGDVAQPLTECTDGMRSRS